VDTAMGVLARVAPQMHVMLFGWPLKIAVGTLTLFLLASSICAVGGQTFLEKFKELEDILKTIK
jgi:flagellar biosynthesis protein FliR